MAGPNIITTDVNELDESEKLVDELSQDIATNFVQEQLVGNEAVGAYKKAASGSLTKAQTRILEEMEKKAKEELADFFKAQLGAGADAKVTLRYVAPSGKTDEVFNVAEYVASFEHKLTSFAQVTQRIKQDEQIAQLQGKLDGQSDYQQLQEKQEWVNTQGRRLAFQTNWFQRNVLRPKTRAERYRRVVAMGLNKFQDATGKIPEADKREATNYIIKKIRARRTTASRVFSKRTFGLTDQFSKSMPGTWANSIFVRRHNKPFTTSEMQMLSKIYKDLKETYENDDEKKDTAELEFLLAQLKDMHGDILEIHENEAKEHEKAVDAFRGLEKTEEES